MVVINLSGNKMKFFIVLIALVMCVQSRREEIADELKELLKDPQIYKLIAKRFQNMLDDDHEKDSDTQETSVVDTTSMKHLPVKRPSLISREGSSSSHTKDDLQKNSLCIRRHGGYGLTNDSKGNRCDYKENQNKIIRSNESVEAGASFLGSKKTNSRCECVKTCCSTKRCTLAVFENKNNHSCYLFDCGNNKCKFADHGSYIAMTLGDHPDESETQHDGSSLDHEGQLKDLGQGSETKRPTPKPTPVPQKTPVPLHAKCDTETGDKCLDKNAACIGGTCSCTENFHDRLNLGVCIMKCTANQFECKSKAGCIRQNQVCDGTRHCSDGSDERDCQKKDEYLAHQGPVNNKVVPPSSSQQQNGKVSSQSDSANFVPSGVHQPVLNSGTPIKQQVPQTILGGYPPLSGPVANQPYGMQQQAYNNLYNPPLGQKLNNAGGYISNPILNPSSSVVNPNQQLQGSYWAPQAANNIPLTQQNSGYYDTSSFLNSNLGSNGLLNGPSQYISPAGAQNRPLYGQDVSGMVNSRLPIPQNIPQGSMDKYLTQGDAVSDSRQYGADSGRHYIPIAGTETDGDRQYVLDNRPGTVSRHFLSNDETGPVRQSNLDPFLQQGYNAYKNGDHDKFQMGYGSRQYVDNHNMKKSTTLTPTTKPTTTSTTTTTTTATTTRATTPPKPTTPAAVPASDSSLDETQFSKWGNSEGGSSLGDNGQNDPLYRSRARGRGRVGKDQNHSASGRKFHRKNGETGKLMEDETRQHKGENQGKDKFGRYQNNGRNRPAGGRQQLNKNRYNYYDLYHGRYPNYPNYDFDSAYYDIPNSDIQMNRPVSYDYETNGKDYIKDEGNDKEDETEQKNTIKDSDKSQGIADTKAEKTKMAPPSSLAPPVTRTPQPKHSSKDDKKVEDKSEQTTEDKTDSKTASKETQSPVKNTQASTKDKSTQSITVETDKNTSSKPNKSSHQSKSKPKTSPKSGTESKKKSQVIQITEEDSGLVVVHTFDDQSKAPIVALSLGLAITLMLLVFVGCRLRNVKRRIRKGRALHSNEADYLINGMYL